VRVVCVCVCAYRFYFPNEYLFQVRGLRHGGHTTCGADELLDTHV
jgi:hypothetical protein